MQKAGRRARKKNEADRNMLGEELSALNERPPRIRKDPAAGLDDLLLSH